MCGEHGTRRLPGGELIGSSPRVRGTQKSACGVLTLRRFIPACAGNTSSDSAGEPPPPVHPRVCGEHPERHHPIHPRHGSSPRVRGTRHATQRAGRERRFIPACAGNTATGSGGCPRPPVHPRVCGEHGDSHAGATCLTGSSPRVRGTLPSHRHPTRHRRFIPACAGNTDKGGKGCYHVPVHPRVCGEHRNLAAKGSGAVGSSPRVRGTRVRQLVPRRPRRFIPACAGNTRPRTAGGGSSPVHPRVCGEHRDNLHKPIHEWRFIPACAGNTNRTPPGAAPSPVHPRVCGEHRSKRAVMRHPSGSSPRVRGTHLRGGLNIPFHRFIPACAGNTSTR